MLAAVRCAVTDDAFAAQTRRPWLIAMGGHGAMACSAPCASSHAGTYLFRLPAPSGMRVHFWLNIMRAAQHVMTRATIPHVVADDVVCSMHGHRAYGAAHVVR